MNTYRDPTLHTDALQVEMRRILQAYELLKPDTDNGNEEKPISNLADAAYLLEQAAAAIRSKVDDIQREISLNMYRDQEL